MIQLNLLILYDKYLQFQLSKPIPVFFFSSNEGKKENVKQVGERHNN